MLNTYKEYLEMNLFNKTNTSYGGTGSFGNAFIKKLSSLNLKN